MKTLLLSLLSLSLLFLMGCDEPQPLESSEFLYNPFSFEHDTSTATAAPVWVSSSWDQNSDYRTWIGQNAQQRAAFSLTFSLDTLADWSNADSLHLRLRHSLSFPVSGDMSIDTLEKALVSVYDGSSTPLDLENDLFGQLITSEEKYIDGTNQFWNFMLDQSTLVNEDSSITLNVQSESTEYITSVYGIKATYAPALRFFFHEPYQQADSAGMDSVTYITLFPDTLSLQFDHLDPARDTSTYAYMSQLEGQGLMFTFPITDLHPSGDTLRHIMDADLLPAVDTLISNIYIPSSADTDRRFHMTLGDTLTGYQVNVSVDESGTLYETGLHIMLQNAVDEGRDEIELLLAPNHIGYDPGMLAIRKDNLHNMLSSYSSKAVRP